MKLRQANKIVSRMKAGSPTRWNLGTANKAIDRVMATKPASRTWLKIIRWGYALERRLA
jgi:hypothetical protein